MQEEDLDLFSTNEPLADNLASTHQEVLANTRPLIKNLKGEQAKLVLEALIENPIESTISGLDQRGRKVFNNSIRLRTILFQLASYSSVKEVHKKLDEEK